MYAAQGVRKVETPYRLYVMKLLIDYSELSSFISAKTGGRRLTFSSSAPDTLKVSLSVKVLGFSKSVSATARVEGLNNGALVVRYDAPLVIEKMIRPTLSLLSKKYHFLEEALALRPDSRIWLYLWKIPQLSPVLDNLELEQVLFTPDAVELEGRLKG